MEKKALVVCCVAILGMVSTATGFAAEFTRVKASQVKIVSITECYYPKSPALGLGLIAAAALLIAQIIINFGTGCICCNRTSKTNKSNWPKARVLYFFSWCTSVIGFIMLLAASAMNHRQVEKTTVYDGNYYLYHYCYVVKPGVYAGAAVLAAVSVILGILCYLTLNQEKNTADPCGDAALPNKGDGIIRGQPQFPPRTSQNPDSV